MVPFEGYSLPLSKGGDKSKSGAKAFAVASRYMKSNLLQNGFLEERIEVIPQFIQAQSEGPPASLSGDVLFVAHLRGIILPDSSWAQVVNGSTVRTSGKLLGRSRN
jgi:hypothetical protein